tara:strand:- start:358 stop:462 length:105 start_codon:yes stop_codon:yes gene_type:complete
MPEYEEVWYDEPNEYEWDPMYSDASIPRGFVEKE